MTWSSVAYAKTFTVDSSDDAIDTKMDGVCSTPQGCTLRAAIQEANADADSAAAQDDLILFDPKTNQNPIRLMIVGPNEDQAATGDLDINGNLTIQGNGSDNTIIDGNWGDRVFDIDPFGLGSLVTIQGITLKNGNTPDNGGGILVNWSGRLRLTASIITANSARYGGGIYNLGEANLMGSCEISSNSATEYGGGLYHNDTFQREMLLENAVIKGNSAGRGGGIYADSAPLKITGGFFESNQASNPPGEGGGLYNYYADTQIINVTFRQNSSNKGGGIFNNNYYFEDPVTKAVSRDGSLTITGSTLSHNHAVSGGGLHNERGEVRLNNTTFSGNTADGDGGGVYNRDYVMSSSVTFSDNTADKDANGSGDGGGLWAYKPGGAAPLPPGVPQPRFNVQNTLVAKNSDLGGNNYSDCAGQVYSLDYNLIDNTAGCTITGDNGTNLKGIDPQLGPLQSNGGPTDTHALKYQFPFVVSPAIDTANPAECAGTNERNQKYTLTTDQRGDPYLRVTDADNDGIYRCDIGAYEYQPRCGDGRQNRTSEECDDGNRVNGDGCDQYCLIERCGNGVIQLGEECDDGNALEGDGCDLSCRREICGNGVLQFGEQCDDANNLDGDGCDKNCFPEVCGNNILQINEQCDDGNKVNGDGCDNRCALEACDLQACQKSGMRDPNTLACAYDLQPPGFACRASGGACDPMETCDGLNPACPDDFKVPKGTVCNAAQGPCDIAESCDGVNNLCPPDAFEPQTKECRAAAHQCDEAELCAGNGPACPGDSLKQDGIACDDQTVCNGNESCQMGVCKNGNPPVLDDGNPCTADACDDVRGVSHTPLADGTPLPDDVKGCTDNICKNGQPYPITQANTLCRSSAGVCDQAEVCDGLAEECPVDGFASNQTVCRAAAGECDVAEQCPGNNPSCPQDGYKADGTACASDNLFCNGSESCESGKCIDGRGTDPCTDDGLNCTTTCNEQADQCNTTDPNSCTINGVCYAAGDLNPQNPCQKCDPGQSKNVWSDLPDESPLVDDNKGCTDNLCKGGSPYPKTAANTLCRSSAGVCDQAEVCDGLAEECPVDGFASNQTVCRTSAGECDVTESCTGNNAACPNDSRKADGAACLDQDLCNGSEACQAGACKPGTPLVCNDVNLCTDDSCNPLKGCEYSNNAVVCDDGDACTQPDQCLNGTCQGPVVNMDKDNTPDCKDGCPNDPLKTDPGQCGCGVPDTDNDQDTVAVCLDCNDDDNSIFPNNPERCDAKDNNCNGEIDETFPDLGKACDGADSDQCARGIYTCKEDGSLIECLNENPANIPEICDGTDNDCDGRVDEGCLCKDGAQQSCGTDEGECGKGTQTCLNGQWGNCEGSVGPVNEICDGKDNNCDASIDEGVKKTFYRDGDGDQYGDPGQSTESCNPPQDFVIDKADCNDGKFEINPKAQELCNGIDDNCNSKTDESFPILGKPCDGSDADSCRSGTYVCKQDGSGTECVSDNDIPEICDGTDNDCNGTIDDLDADKNGVSDCEAPKPVDEVGVPAGKPIPFVPVTPAPPPAVPPEPVIPRVPEAPPEPVAPSVPPTTPAATPILPQKEPIPMISFFCRPGSWEIINLDTDDVSAASIPVDWECPTPSMNQMLRPELADFARRSDAFLKDPANKEKRDGVRRMMASLLRSVAEGRLDYPVHGILMVGISEPGQEPAAKMVTIDNEKFRELLKTEIDISSQDGKIIMKAGATVDNTPMGIMMVAAFAEGTGGGGKWGCSLMTQGR